MSDISWVKLINGNINFEVMTKVLPTKGNLVYEYNPFRNYRLSQVMLEYKGEYYTEEQLKNEFNIKPVGKKWMKNNTEDVSDDVILHEKGELVDFVTDELSFSIKSPVTITPQYSYDGSVNLIINDGVNIPRMINSRFSATGRNTYEIVDRKGNNDTNIYDQGEQFDIDTSLYKRVIKIPKIKFNGVTSGGNLKVGNYHLYFKLSDADGNETDFVGESGLISVFKGFDEPSSITSGQGNENSYKSIQIQMTNIDTAYSYVYVYYSRYTAVDQEQFSTEYIKVDKKFIINNSGISTILVTGFEDSIPISASDINLNYNVIDAANTSTSCQNMLFLGNVHKPEIPYNELQDLSLRFLPFLKQENYQVDMDERYRITTSNKGYYDPQFIYDKTGYWGEEIYRIGIVYIMPNNELTPVFNIRGANNICEYKGYPGLSNDIFGEYNDGQFSEIPVWKIQNGKKIRNYIQYNESDYTVLVDEQNKARTDSNEHFQEDHKNGMSMVGVLNSSLENVKGVIRMLPSKDTKTVYGLDIRVDNETLQELKKYVKGYFFVRQTRIPTILCQGITIGIDQNSFTPCVATADGYLSEVSEQLEKTHVTTEDINDVNYITEGFLSRYSFKFEKKHSGLFGSILKGVLIGVGVVALAAATVFTCGAAGAIVAGATLAAAASAGAGAVVAAAAAVGSVVAGASIAAAAAAAGTTTAAIIAAGTAVSATIGAIAIGAVATVGVAATIATLGAIQEVRYGVGRIFAKKKLDGRNTKCPSGYKIVETDDSRKLSQEYIDRLIIKDKSKVKVQAILCPDYEVNQGYFNSVFTGNKHKIGLTIAQCTNGLMGHSLNYFTNDYRHFYVPSYYDMNIRNSYDFKVIGVPDDVTLTGIDNLKFRSRAGVAEEAWRYECVGDDYKSEYSKNNVVEDEETISNKEINSDIIRGSFGPYLAFNDTANKFSPAETVNIYIPEYKQANMNKYFEVRMQDNTPFQAISDRLDINETDKQLIEPLSFISGDPNDSRMKGYQYELYRGDCYICQFTHRMHRNFNDPGAPYNDEIVQLDTWKEHYKTDEPEQYNEINLGDVNAVQIGNWVTFTVRSSYNLNIRTLDGSDVAETAMCGHPHGYFPYNDMIAEGSYKHADSQVYNKGFSKSLSERFNMELPDVPYIKNWFGTRIMYSDIHINDAYKNGFRVFRPTAYRDYTREYGEIVKLITLESDLICVFEHGVARIPVNKSAVAQQVAAGANQVTTSNVLPEAPIILSDMFGSQWADSVLKTPGKAGNAKQYVYGVDTVAKKIWRTDGQTLECISDMKVQEFLNNNITLSERENTPILGIRNVKTCYNSFKRDVMFTFYDNTYGFEEKVWNLCWSELLNKFITFYSWVPAMMEDINNIPFSFDRNVSKWIAKLGTSHANNSFADGITLTNTVINNYFKSDASKRVVDKFTYEFSYRIENGTMKTVTREVPDDNLHRDGFIGVLGLANRVLPDSNLFYTVDYSLERDPWGNYKNFEIKEVDDFRLGPKVAGDPDEEEYIYQDASFNERYKVYGLYLKTSDDPKEEKNYVYNSTKTGEDAGVWALDPPGVENYESLLDDDRRVFTKGDIISPEVMMTELYYRNSAGHAYADYEINKVKYTVNENGKPEYAGIEGDFSVDKPLNPEQRYNINQIVLYVAKNWYRAENNQLPSGTPNSDVYDNEWAKGLLKQYGGPFDYDTAVYLGSYRGGFYACSGGLGDLITRGNRHAPFSDHFMFGNYVNEILGKREDFEDLPIFKDINGKRPMLPRDEQLNPDKVVTLLNIKAKVKILDKENANSLNDTYYNMKASYSNNSGLVSAAQYESVVGITTKWNLQFLTSDFWKHGQAGLIDIADDIYPTYWYGKQHPFEFECVVVDDPSIHKIFTNLELVANKAKPESFHYEVVGEAYDFAKDKVNMYFRQEALKALWQYNGADIMYDRNFLKVQPRQQPKSADFVHRYYTRQDTINDIEDYYIHVTYPRGYDYRHLSGAEIVYYPTRQEFRIWNHAMAVDLKDLSQDDARSLIAGNCEYLEDRWKVTINPILVCYKNEYKKTHEDNLPLISPAHSTWSKAFESNQLLPPLPITNSPIPDQVKEKGGIDFPGVNENETELDRSNALYHLYDVSNFGKNGDYRPLDPSSWLDNPEIYSYMFGQDHNRKETDVRDKFMKVRIRYTGDELAIIDFLNTIYQVSYA